MQIAACAVGSRWVSLKFHAPSSKVNELSDVGLLIYWFQSPVVMEILRTL